MSTTEATTADQVGADGTPLRVTATPAAVALIEELRAEHGPVMFHQSGGCCDGSSPMCYPVGDFAHRRQRRPSRPGGRRRFLDQPPAIPGLEAHPPDPRRGARPRRHVLAGERPRQALPHPLTDLHGRGEHGARRRVPDLTRTQRASLIGESSHLVARRGRLRAILDEPWKGPLSCRFTGRSVRPGLVESGQTAFGKETAKSCYLHGIVSRSEFDCDLGEMARRTGSRRAANSSEPMLSICEQQLSASG